MPEILAFLKRDIKEKREYINMMMDRFLPRKDDYPKDIHKAIRHTLFAGGKRIRPYLTILTYQILKKKMNDDVIKAGVALEFLHTYTLIHDDLPEIDNDEFRRGKKACHIVFGSDIALLAGDALLIEAFNVITTIEAPSDLRMKMINDLAIFCGERGLIAGQMQDIISEKTTISKKSIDFINLNKTAKLIQLALRFGAYLGEATPAQFAKFDELGLKIGLSFQIVDDILDIEGNTHDLGKTVGKDQKAYKMTYPLVHGLEKSKQIAEKYTNEAIKIIDSFGDKALLLRDLTIYLLSRNY